MAEPRQSQRILVSGRVQGVGYRRFAQKKAQIQNLRGWARNLVDGRVEIFVEGSARELQEYQEHLRQGPAFSQVENLTIEQSSSANLPAEGFEIRPDGGTHER